MTATEPVLCDKLAAVQARIRAAALAAGRDPADIRLLAVSKGQPAAAIQAALAAGQMAFGENYVQEALAKIAAIPGPEWHYIGRLQSNKTQVVAAAFAWVHTVDRLKIAERLSAQRPANLPPLNICLQVNVDAAPTKGGVTPAELPALARAMAALPRVRLRGLMAIPAPADTQAAQRAPLRRLGELKAALCAEGLALDTLSMGMSDDLEAAVAEGSTLVRIGTAIFGPRNTTPDG